MAKMTGIPALQPPVVCLCMSRSWAVSVRPAEHGACTQCSDCGPGVCQAVLHHAECCAGTSAQVAHGSPLS